MLIVRHGIAEDRQAFAQTGRSDGERPLTELGIERMRRAAKALAKLEPTLDLLASSRLERAMQTAELIAARYDVPLVPIDELDPSASLSQLSDWVRAQEEQTVALVGHEPQLSMFVSWLVCGSGRTQLTLKKGGACLVDLPTEIDAGQGVLKWLLPPSALRRL